ncbi:hypothetical protein [Pantoea dispersa]|uniref:hypothetical protein n=1 Tax=Pantoea dispersa TaxID=59814 RepID=UPI0021C5C4EB|nr:hypothetical protein [Pantoea dispersa]UXO70832.1 hypothetical protein N7977_19640 [Pantoea dispersa]
MTAEIAVFNSTALALAADSAVTINNNDFVKINNSANKLFELCKKHPVGIMIFNNSALAGAPWELLIKSYRQKNANTPKDTINDYVNDLVSFLQEDKLLINDYMRMKSAQTLFSRQLAEFTQYITQTSMVALMQANSMAVTVLDFYKLLDEKLDEEIATLNNKNFFPTMNEDDYIEALDYVSAYVQESYVQIIPIDPSQPVPASTREKLVKFAALLICKQNNTKSFTGIVIAGYGEKEYYPAIKTIHIYGLFKEKLLYIVDEDKTKISDPYQAGICPFAQEDEVVTFIEGCSRNVNNFTNTLVHELILKSRNSLEGFISDKLSPEDFGECLRVLERVQNNYFEEFKQKKQAFIASNHVTKMLSMLNSLEKVDLAYMAESLVDITAFKRRISNDHETVGGPVDVAVISKGDGFVWIKRKHYFPKELNKSFFDRNS